MIICDTFREAAQYAIRSDEPAYVFDHPGEQGYAVLFGDDAREMMDAGIEPYSEIQTVVAAAMPAVPDGPPE